MEALAEEIVNILQDYHNYNGFHFNSFYVLKWVKQFDSIDQEFILTEFLHLLRKGIYLSETKARQVLISTIEKCSADYGFKELPDLILNSQFLNLQPRGKSQSVLLNLLNDEINKKYGVDLAKCGSSSQKYSFYIDDIIATGGTFFRNISEWLNIINEDGETNLSKVITNKKILIVCVLCAHSWSKGLVLWRLKMHFQEDAILKKIFFYCYYEIQNHPAFGNQKLNCAYPNSDQPPLVHNYFHSLKAQNKADYAFRPQGKPMVECFFSTPKNRIRFENVLLYKGILLLEKVKDLKDNHRPMGAVTPSYKVLGTGTLFFTWRNISNTTPIVFWWAASGWFPLFPLINRGLGSMRTTI